MFACTLGASTLGACGGAAAAAPPAPSILLVSLDTFRADRLGVFGNSRGLTPNLDAFAGESVAFSSAWSQANLTSMSHASVFTSRYPSELGAVGPDFALGGEAPTLASVLALYGYDTAGFSAGGQLSSAFGLDRGFGTFAATPGLGSFWNTVPAALRWLDGRSSTAPFLLLVHSYDTHAPYSEPPPFGLAWTTPGYTGAGDLALGSLLGTELVFDNALFRDASIISWLHERGAPRGWDAQTRSAVAARAAEQNAVPFTDADAQHVRDVYDGAAAYADGFFGQLVAELRERDLYDRLVIVVLGDHGEALGEAGRFGHGESLADAELHVPLLVRVPGGTPHRVDAPVALLDVTPTLLDLAGATPIAQARGSSLAPWLRGAEGRSHPVVYAEGNGRMISARGPAGRLTFTGVSAGSPYLDALLAEAAIDGKAFEGDTTVAAPQREALRAELLAWRGTLEPPHEVHSADPAAVEEMRKHGYWAPPAPENNP